jgi:hypothetical protein
MRYSEIQRGMTRREAAKYVGGGELLSEFERLFGLRPFVKKNRRLTRYDVRDLDRCIDRQKTEQLIKTPGQCPDQAVTA